MINAMSGLACLPCIKKGLLAQSSVADVVAVGRKILRHSDFAYSCLEDSQVWLNKPIERLH